MAIIMMHSPIATGQTVRFFSPECFAAMLAVAAFLLSQPQVSRAQGTAQQQEADCSEIIDDMARLRCYDNNADKFEEISGRATSIAALPANTEAPATNLQTDDSLGEKYLPEDDSHESDRESSLQLVQAYKSKRELWVFEFENGQAWQQIEARYLSVPKDLPAAVIISEGVLGSYDLRIGESGRTIKVKRLR
jgi:hypothetical protein